MAISQKDREVLRDLARYQLELANSPRNKQVYADWLANGSSKTQVTRPLIRIETNTFEHQIMPPMMK